MSDISNLSENKQHYIRQCMCMFTTETNTLSDPGQALWLEKGHNPFICFRQFSIYS